jgi:hypothetical protein
MSRASEIKATLNPEPVNTYKKYLLLKEFTEKTKKLAFSFYYQSVVNCIIKVLRCPNLP